MILTRVPHYLNNFITCCITYAVLAIIYRGFQGPRGSRCLMGFLVLGPGLYKMKLQRNEYYDMT